jgi:hypothetical protein
MHRKASRAFFLLSPNSLTSMYTRIHTCIQKFMLLLRLSPLKRTNVYTHTYIHTYRNKFPAIVLFFGLSPLMHKYTHTHIHTHIHTWSGFQIVLLLRLSPLKHKVNTHIHIYMHRFPDRPSPSPESTPAVFNKQLHLWHDKSKLLGIYGGYSNRFCARNFGVRNDRYACFYLLCTC